MDQINFCKKKMRKYRSLDFRKSRCYCLVTVLHAQALYIMIVEKFVGGVKNQQLTEMTSYFQKQSVSMYSRENVIHF